MGFGFHRNLAEQALSYLVWLQWKAEAFGENSIHQYYRLPYHLNSTYCLLYASGVLSVDWKVHYS